MTTFNKPLYPENNPNKKSITGKQIAMVGFGLLFIAITINTILHPESEQKPEPVKQLTPAEMAEKRREDSTLAVYEARIQIRKNLRYLVKSHIKENLKDPDSFQEIEHGEYELSKPTKKRFFQAFIKYRAKNSFGGYNVEKYCFDFAEDGTNTKIFQCE